MKAILFIAVLFAALACGTTKSIADETPATRSENRIIGIVHLNQEPCGTVIIADNEGTEEIFIPQNLEEKFAVEGMKLKFYFTRQTGAKGKCKATPVTLEEVTIMR